MCQVGWEINPVMHELPAAFASSALGTGQRMSVQTLTDRRAPRGTLSHWRGAAAGIRIRKIVARAERVTDARLL